LSDLVLASNHLLVQTFDKLFPLWKNFEQKWLYQPKCLNNIFVMQMWNVDSSLI